MSCYFSQSARSIESMCVVKKIVIILRYISWNYCHHRNGYMERIFPHTVYRTSFHQTMHFQNHPAKALSNYNVYLLDMKLDLPRSKLWLSPSILSTHHNVDSPYVFYQRRFVACYIIHSCVSQSTFDANPYGFKIKEYCNFKSILKCNFIFLWRYYVLIGRNMSRCLEWS